MTEENQPAPPAYLNPARRHLTEAHKILAARPESERGTAAEEGALLIARAQAEATLGIAVILTGMASAAPDYAVLADAVKRLADAIGPEPAETLLRGLEGAVPGSVNALFEAVRALGSKT